MILKQPPCRRRLVSTEPWELQDGGSKHGRYDKEQKSVALHRTLIIGF